MCLRVSTVFDWFHDHHVRLNPLLAGLRPAQYAKWCAPCLPTLRALVTEAFPALLYRPPYPVADRRSSSKTARSIIAEWLPQTRHGLSSPLLLPRRLSSLPYRSSHSTRLSCAETHVTRSCTRARAVFHVKPLHCFSQENDSFLAPWSCALGLRTPWSHMTRVARSGTPCCQVAAQLDRPNGHDPAFPSHIVNAEPW